MTGETIGQNIDDGVLTSSVKTQFASDRLTPCHLWGVETNNTVVCLTGEIETAEQSSALDRLVKGVRQVVNNVQVIKR
jgi:osmotically-inducible protein OsmY